jgi:hypothetical protein
VSETKGAPLRSALPLPETGSLPVRAAPGMTTRARRRAARYARFISLAAVIACLVTLTWRESSTRGQSFHFGDDADYILMAQSIAEHGSPDARPDDAVAALSQLGKRWSVGVRKRFAAWPHMPGYFPDRKGQLYNWHFWTYPSYVAVFKRRLDSHGLGAIAFALANTVVFCAALLSLLQLWRMPRVWFAIVPLAFFSPLLWFLPLAHTEAFVYSLLLIAVACRLRRRYLLATLISALAATQFQPLALLSGVFAIEGLFAQRRPDFSAAARLRRGLWFSCALAGAAVTLAPSAFYYRHYGVTSVISREGFAASRLMSFDKFRSMFIDLDTGLVTYMPGVLLMLLYSLGLVAIRSARERSVRALIPWAVVAFILWSTTSALNWNYHTQGVSRYALYCTPALLMLIAIELERRRPSASSFVVIALALGLQLQVHRAFGWYEFRGHNGLHHNVVARYVLERWPSLYRPPPEIFCSRTRRQRCVLDPGTGLVAASELPVIFYDRAGHPRKALAPTCARAQLLGAYGWTSEQAARIRDTLPPCEPNRLAYVDFD